MSDETTMRRGRGKDNERKREREDRRVRVNLCRLNQLQL